MLIPWYFPEPNGILFSKGGRIRKERMKKIVVLIIVILCGCTSKEELYNGNFEEKSYTFQQITKNQGFNKAYSQQLKVDGISKTLSISDKTTSPGYPYSFDIYKNVPHVILDSVTYLYNNKYEDAATNFAVLYIHPDRFSKEDFDFLSLFFRTEWPLIKNKIPLFQGYRSLQLVALVYGTDSQFELQYINKETPITKTITVQTDGRILYSEAFGTLQSTNLSDKIQMPGAVIYVQEGGQYSIDDLRGFRSKRDRPLELDFDLLTQSVEPSNLMSK